MTAGETLFDAMRRYTTELGLNYSVEDEGRSLRITFRGNHGQWDCIALADADEEQCLLYSLSPIRPDEPERQAMAELITRINYGLRIGNFEMDFADGDVRFKTSLDVQNEPLTLRQFNKLVLHNALEMDRYLPAIQAVAAGVETPVHALAHIEGMDDE